MTLYCSRCGDSENSDPTVKLRKPFCNTCWEAYQNGGNEDGHECEDTVCSESSCSRSAEVCAYHTECIQCSEQAVRCEDHSMQNEENSECNRCGTDSMYGYRFCVDCFEKEVNERVAAELAKHGIKRGVEVVSSETISVDGMEFNFNA